MRVLIGNLREVVCRNISPTMATAWDRSLTKRGYQPADSNPVIAAGLASMQSPGWRFRPRRKFGIGGRRHRRRRIALMMRAAQTRKRRGIRYINPAHRGECNAPGPCEGCDALDWGRA